MSNSKSIIPEFMSDNPNDTFSFLLPLRIKLDKTDYSKSHFNVIVKNLTKNEVFDYEISPEILFTHYPFDKPYKNGKFDQDFDNTKIKEESFSINTSHSLNSIYLRDILSEKNVVSLVGWKRKFLFKANYINCYLIEEDGYNLIIPQFTIALYYYYRSTRFRESALGCKLEDLFISCDCEDDNASIILPEYLSNTDAALLHRFAYQNTSRENFDDIGRFIPTYLKSVKEKQNKDIDEVPIKAKFPTKEEFAIKGRTSKLYNEETNKTYYFVHEIVNDYSSIGFKKLTKYLQKDKNIIEIDDLDDLSVINQEEPAEVTEVLKRKAASRRVTQKRLEKDKKGLLGSLNDINFENEELTNEKIQTIIKIVEETPSSQSYDQSLTESSDSNEEKIRKTVISSSFEKDLEEYKPKINIKNFEKFNQYMNYLRKQSLVKIDNIQINEEKVLTDLIDKKTNEVNKKCFLYGRKKQYITAIFKYKDLNIGLLELENRESSSSSTWVIISTNNINENTFSIFLKHYFENNLSINDIKKTYKDNSQLKFRTKNHERVEILYKDDLTRWIVGLASKLQI